MPTLIRHVTYLVMAVKMPAYWKMPPRIKVLEALGAIADGRIEMVGEREARVVSSEGDRVYTVKWDGGRGITADDNGSVYRGYLGYPSIAFLMLKGLLPYDEELAKALKGLPWRRLNEKFKSYRLVEEYIKSDLSEKGISPSRVDSFIRLVLSSIKKLRPYKI